LFRYVEVGFHISCGDIDKLQNPPGLPAENGGVRCVSDPRILDRLKQLIDFRKPLLRYAKGHSFLTGHPLESIAAVQQVGRTDITSGYIYYSEDFTATEIRGDVIGQKWAFVRNLVRSGLRHESGT